MADVSIGTVSNYLNKSAPVSPETQTNIQRAIDQLGYKRNEIARSLRRAKTKTLGVIFPNVTNPYYSSLFDGAEEEARSHGYTITLGISHYDNAVVEEYLSSFRDSLIAGVLIDAYSTYASAEVLGRAEMPIVVIEPAVDQAARPPWSTIRVDDRIAACEAVSYLISLGHRRIACIAHSGDSARSQGYRLAHERHGVELDPNLIFEFGQDAEFAEGDRAMRALLARTSFTACFAQADVLAIGAMKVLRESGYRVPQDVAMVGFDDISFAALTDPPLTTIAQPHREMGRLAVQILLQQLEKTESFEPVQAILDHHLIIRGST